MYLGTPKVAANSARTALHLIAKHLGEGRVVTPSWRSLSAEIALAELCMKDAPARPEDLPRH